MILYHHTPHAERILTEGFHDEHGYYLLGHRLWSGVWLEDTPAAHDGPGWHSLAIEIPDEEAAPFELRDLDKRLPFKEYVIPAEIVNRHGRPHPLDGDGAGAPASSVS